MSSLNNNPFLLASGNPTDPTFPVQRSVRLRSSASAYFNRTFSAAGNSNTWTFSIFLKRGNFSTGSNIFNTATPIGTNNNVGQFYFGSNNKLGFFQNTGGVTYTDIVTTAVFRDPSAWYHIVLRYDDTQATAANRVRIYVNNVQITAFDTASYPTQNFTSFFNAATPHVIGLYAGASGGDFFDGYLTEINFVGGQSLDPSSFGAYNSTTGVWQPIRYAGTYGTNGFYLNFKDNTSTTTLGYDYSGNSNNWTANNISLTAGATYDSMTDVPTLTSASAANFATFNPINLSTTSPPTVSNGNLQSATTTTGLCVTLGTIGISSGKFYWEITPTAFSGVVTYDIGVANASVDLNQYLGQNSNSWGYYTDGNKYTGGTPTSYGASYTTNDVIGVALDMDAGTLIFYKNGTSQGTAFTGLTGTLFPAISDGSSAYSATFVANFGQRPFAYTPPSGYNRLCTYNLATPTIPNGAAQFAATTYTGTGATRSITNTVNGISFQPDFIWMKNRSNVADHALYDALRTAMLSSNTTAAEVSASNVITYNSNGFTISGGDSRLNANTNTYVGWQWKASNATAVTNTAGSITSSVSANPTAGFSIVTYTGTGANATVGHGLGVAPSFIIVKCRNTAATGWLTYARPLTATSFLQLESTAAVASNATAWNNTSPTSSVFTVGTSAFCNGNTQTYVAYCFSEIAGFSKFGSYTGNGSADGVFVHLGFRPRWVMIKRTDAGAESWNIHDSVRLGYNQVDTRLISDAANAEVTSAGVGIDILSNGFKVRTTNTGWNASGGTYIYAAFAENPFKYSLAR